MKDDMDNTPSLPPPSIYRILQPGCGSSCLCLCLFPLFSSLKFPGRTVEIQNFDFSPLKFHPQEGKSIAPGPNSMEKFLACFGVVHSALKKIGLSGYFPIFVLHLLKSVC